MKALERCHVATLSLVVKRVRLTMGAARAVVGAARAAALGCVLGSCRLA